MPLTLDTDASQHGVNLVVAHYIVAHSLLWSLRCEETVMQKSIKEVSWYSVV